MQREQEKFIDIYKTNVEGVFYIEALYGPNSCCCYQIKDRAGMDRFQNSFFSEYGSFVYCNADQSEEVKRFIQLIMGDIAKTDIKDGRGLLRLSSIAVLQNPSALESKHIPDPIKKYLQTTKKELQIAGVALPPSPVVDRPIQK